jgi:acetyl esterase/lipase
VEGEEIAGWLNSLGITGIILKYRCPRRPGDVKGVPPIGPLKDAQRAISLVRSKAKEYRIDPQRIGMVGFSAGGHLTLATATNFDRRSYESIDAVDQVSCRPDFAAAVYPGYLLEQHPAGVEINKHALAPYIRIPKEAPPILLVHASDDTVAGAENSVLMSLALKRVNVPAELHVYARGGNGFGVRKSDLPCSSWPDRCIDWLRNLGMLSTDPVRVPRPVRSE